MTDRIGLPEKSIGPPIGPSTSCASRCFFGSLLSVLCTTSNKWPTHGPASAKGVETAGSWHGFSETPRQENAREITEALFEAFNLPAEDGGVDEIHIVYTEFVSMLTQNAVVHRIIPLVIEETTEAPVGGPIPLYEFEPSPQVVLDDLLPWYVESRIYQALLEAAAAEIAARRRAMKSATDNANDLLEEFTREANKARQAEITQEISEIVGGADAMAESVAGKE